MNAARVAWSVGGIGLLGCVLAAIFEPGAFGSAWLAALTTWLRWPLGSLALILVHALTGGRWGMVVRPWLLLGVFATPFLVPVLIPVLLLVRHLYPWARPDAVLANGFYLNLPFAALRCAFYLVVWIGLAALVLGRRNRPLNAIAAPGLILLGLTFNFAAIDAVMSLDPHFNSSVFGMMDAAETGLFALCLATLASVCAGPIAPAEQEDLAKLLQGLLILWAYLDFMQLLIIWQSDLPKEAAWYVARLSGFWGYVAAVIAVVHFLLPFFALLVPGLRRSRRGIMGVTGLLLVMSVLRGWWLVLPATQTGLNWIDIAAVMAFGGLSVGLVLRGPSPSWRVTHA